MRIDFHYAPQSTTETDRGRGAVSSSALGGSTATVEAPRDQAQLSRLHSQVQVLIAQALNTPEIRESRVQALREAIRTGQYVADPAQTAGALMRDMAGRVRT